MGNLLIKISTILLLFIIISCSRPLTHEDIEARKVLEHKLDEYETYELCELWDETYTNSNITQIISRKGPKQDRIEISKTLIRKGEDPLLCRKKG